MRRTLELSPRLEMVAGLVPRGARLADVGTDHAYLPVSLILSGHIPGAIAADLRQGPLNRARQTVRTWDLTGQIAFRLCDGLKGIAPEETDAVAIAGMGGETIAGILEAALWTRERNIPLILQPMSSMPDLRRWLAGHGYRIVTEDIAREGDTLYTAWSVRAGEMGELSPAELWAGKNSPHPLRGEWLELWLGKLRRALEGLERSSQESAAARRQELESVCQELEDMKKEWKAWQ